jgi:hypothetical protein
MPDSGPRLRPAVAPVALCVFVAALGALPHILFARDWGSFGAFKGSYDEDTYLLGDLATVPSRLLSDGVVHLLNAVTPSVESLMLVADVVLPVLVALAVWSLVVRLVDDTGLRLLAALLLLFGPSLLSMADLVVWPVHGIAQFRASHPPLTMELIPDSTISYFSLFRTPEPQVSWVVLFASLAALAGPSPLDAFEGRRRWITLALFAILPLTYVFVAVPIACLAAALLAWAVVYDRRRARGVLIALGVAAASLAVVTVATAGRTGPGFSVIFASRLPVVTPAVVLGLLVAAGFAITYRGQVLRQPRLFIAVVASLLPAAISNQQLITGHMVSARDWERYVNYALVSFALICLVGLFEKRADKPRGLLWPWVRASVWAVTAVLAVQLVVSQRNGYDIWRPINLAAHDRAALLDRVPNGLASLPVVVESVGFVPEIRLITDDRSNFVLDYTRLFDNPNPSFADGWADSEAQHANRRRLFEYAFRLGRSPTQLADQLRTELSNPNDGGFYSHFLFSLIDVWPPITDWRALHRDEALDQLPAQIAAYRRYVRRHEATGLPPALLIADGQPEDPGDGRVNQLLASAQPRSGTAPRLYVQRFP